MVARAWDLREVEQRHEVFIDDFTGLPPADADATLHALTLLVHEGLRTSRRASGLRRTIGPWRRRA